MTASSLQIPSKRSSIDAKSHLFKKQRLRCNPTFTEPKVFNNVLPDDLQEEAIIYDDNNASLCDSNPFLMEFQADANFASLHRSVGTVNSSSEKVFDGTMKPPPVENDYACFTTSQKCITSLMYLLDEMECPDYAFQWILDWAHNGYGRSRV